MNRHLPRLLIASLLAFALASCSTGSLVPEEHSMPAARASLKPEFRLFYDALQDYGEWVLIEPWGYVFRPRANFNDWRPYGQGMWVPTDTYGWVWVSSEPYGWATYHYGDWLYDPYQGWVWQPGLDWSPAQVVWQAGDNYVGWAARMPDDGQYANVPNGAFNYVATKDLTSSDLGSRVVHQQGLDPVEASHIKLVENIDHREGLTFNRGPRLDWIERYTGLLKRAQVQDLVPGTAPAPEKSAGTGRTRQTETSGLYVKRQALKAIEDARAAGPTPRRLSMVRPYGPAKKGGPSWLPVNQLKAKSAEPDSSSH
jgi:hypothetical protein